MYNVWCGLSFERVVAQHILQVKKALGIAGVLTEEYAWHNDEAQIDLLIDRQDGVINLCEMKFYNSEIHNIEEISNELVRKRNVLLQNVKTKKAVFLTLISSYGAVARVGACDIQNELTINDLFA